MSSVIFYGRGIEGSTFHGRGIGGEFFRGLQDHGPLDSVYFSTYHKNVSHAARQKSHEMYGGEHMGDTSLPTLPPHKTIMLHMSEHLILYKTYYF